MLITRYTLPIFAAAIDSARQRALRVGDMPAAATLPPLLIAPLMPMRADSARHAGYA